MGGPWSPTPTHSMHPLHDIVRRIRHSPARRRSFAMHIRHIVPAVAVLAVVGAAAPAAQAASTPTSSAPASSNTRSVSRQLEISAAKTESDAYLQYAGYSDGAFQN